MNSKNIEIMLKTRLEMARDEGNTTEESFLFSLWKLVEEYKKLKESEEEK